MVRLRDFLKRFRGIAQLVEQRSPKPRAEGSNPVRVTNSFLTACAKPFTIEEVLRRNLENEVGAD